MDELRRRKDRAWRTLRELKARGEDTADVVLEAARKHAEAAEAQWRAARPSAPLGLRLTRTAAKLDKAIGIQQRNLREWDEFEADVLAKRGRMAKRAAEDADRVALHKQALDTLNREMAGGEGGGESIVVSADKSAAWAVAGLGGVVPLLREVLAALPEDSAHRRALEQARSETEAVAALLQNRRVPVPAQKPENADPEKYDMAGHDDEWHEDYDDFDEMEDVGGDDLGDEWADDAGPNAGRAQPHSWTSRWRHSGGGSWGSGSWQRTAGWGSEDLQRDGKYDATSTAAPTPSNPSPHSTALTPPPPSPSSTSPPPRRSDGSPHGDGTSRSHWTRRRAEAGPGRHLHFGGVGAGKGAACQNLGHG